MKLLTLLIALSVGSFTFGHDYFFAFAEVEYNDITQKFETTITATTHDLEKSIRLKGISSKELDQIEMNSDEWLELQAYINHHFKIETQSSHTKFHIIGIEVFLNGTCNIYMESDEMSIENELIVTFDLLMKDFEGQQNKITFYYRNKNYTLPFIEIDEPKTIEITNE